MFVTVCVSSLQLWLRKEDLTDAVNRPRKPQFDPIPTPPQPPQPHPEPSPRLPPALIHQPLTPSPSTVPLRSTGTQVLHVPSPPTSVARVCLETCPDLLHVWFVMCPDLLCVLTCYCMCPDLLYVLICSDVCPDWLCFVQSQNPQESVIQLAPARILQATPTLPHTAQSASQTSQFSQISQISQSPSSLPSQQQLELLQQAAGFQMAQQGGCGCGVGERERVYMYVCGRECVCVCERER